MRRLGEVPRLDLREVTPSEVIRAARPVVFVGAAASWPARSRWTPDYFDRVLGDETIEVVRASDPERTPRDRRHSPLQTHLRVSFLPHAHSINTPPSTLKRTRLP